MKFYQRLKDVREDRDIKQATVAAKLGMKQPQYSRYELGKQELPLHHYKTLAQFYNVSVDYLCGLIPTPRPLHEDKA